MGFEWWMERDLTRNIIVRPGAIVKGRDMAKIVLGWPEHKHIVPFHDGNGGGVLVVIDILGYGVGLHMRQIWGDIGCSTVLTRDQSSYPDAIENSLVWLSHQFGYHIDWGVRVVNERAKMTDDKLDPITHLIIAGSFRQAQMFAQGQGWVPTEWIYVCDENHIYGRMSQDGVRPGYDIHFTGTYWLNRMIDNPLVRMCHDQS